MKKFSDYELRGDLNPYQWVLEQAGAKVLAFSEFGSYQGDWYAKVEYKGKSGWIKDSYGSCSGCDAFESETGYEDKTRTEWKAFCKSFAKEYLKEIRTFDEVMKEAKENESWDMEAKDIVKWLIKNK